MKLRMIYAFCPVCIWWRGLMGVALHVFQHGINFNELPAWQKRGSGVYWQTLEKIGFNPKTGENVKTQRRELWVNTELLVKELYANWLVQSFLN